MPLSRHQPARTDSKNHLMLVSQFLHLGNDGTDVSGYTDPLQTAADGLRRNRKKRGRDILVYGSPGFGTVP